MTQEQATKLIRQNEVIIALLHAQIIAGNNAAALAIANKQMEIASQI